MTLSYHGLADIDRTLYEVRLDGERIGTVASVSKGWTGLADNSSRLIGPYKTRKDVGIRLMQDWQDRQKRGGS